ncbi:MAG: acyl carrier protein [Ruminococcaceae bacterium]|nr:acyl carrier protein [Oscillospiraceae bacterium]
MEKLYEILREINDEIDYETCTDLIDGHQLESLAILALIADLEDEFDITIPATEIIPENFNSASAMYSMITRLQEDE